MKRICVFFIIVLCAFSNACADPPSANSQIDGQISRDTSWHDSNDFNSNTESEGDTGSSTHNDVDSAVEPDTGLVGDTDTGIAEETDSQIKIDTAIDSATDSGGTTDTGTDFNTVTDSETATDPQIDSDNDSDTGLPPDTEVNFLLVVEQSILALVSESLNIYLEDIRPQGYYGKIVSYDGGDATVLKHLIQSEYHGENIVGAFLIGDLPSAWYRQFAFGTWEEFPCDIFLADMDDDWRQTANEIYISRPVDFQVEIFTSRIMGSASEINAYFTKNHLYRTQGSLVAQTAFNFIEEEWEAYVTDEHFNLDALYDTVEICMDSTCTTRANYIDTLTGTGAEFLQQRIHALPCELLIDGGGPDSSVTCDDVASNNFKTSFVDLWNCSGCRFTQRNLGMTYLMNTDYGLATIGSTKTGALLYEQYFFSYLAAGRTWGEAGKEYFNTYGYCDDEWHLGIVTMGDPLLTVKGNTTSRISRLSNKPALTPLEISELYDKFAIVAQQTNLMGFSHYKANNPQHFER
ncbi:MAG: hypothetical protein JXR76_31685 [Deltaproteobacteria bacterium]|nr:hypothetical protein [Deltaproteobacteria bacterium]